MDRRSFLKAVVAVPMGALALRPVVSCQRAWWPGMIVGQFPLGTGPLRPALCGDFIVGVWDGTRIVRAGRVATAIQSAEHFDEMRKRRFTA